MQTTLQTLLRDPALFIKYIEIEATTPLPLLCLGCNDNELKLFFFLSKGTAVDIQPHRQLAQEMVYLLWLHFLSSSPMNEITHTQ